MNGNGNGAAGGAGEQTTLTDGPAVLECMASCTLGGVDDTWYIDEMDAADEVRDAIDAVRADHDEERLIDPDNGIWIHKVSWNEKTEAVCVMAFGIKSEFAVRDGVPDE